MTDIADLVRAEPVERVPAGVVSDGSAEANVATERVDGVVLEYAPVVEEIEARRHLSVDQSVALTLDLCTAMAQAHENNVVHRDLKPANVIVRSVDGADAVIIDLGLSFNKDKHQNVTTSSEAFGNEFLRLPEYESRDPELRRDRREHARQRAVDRPVGPRRRGQPLRGEARVPGVRTG